MLHPGLIVLHGNRLEDLLDAAAGWLQEQPLAPLEQESVLVQSQGMGEWLRMELAARHGICAALRVELPARFLWRAYRAVLGSGAVPLRSPLDKSPLTWRLMAQLPGWVEQFPAVSAPLASFLAGGSSARRLQLAERLADLFDQYQVYRADWLQDWEAGSAVLRRLPGDPQPVPLAAEDAWQPQLWQALLATLPPDKLSLSRPAIHAAFLDRLAAAGEARPPGLPRRLVVFGTTHIPQQTLEAIAQLATSTQVLLAVPNPCRHYWADLLPDRELLVAARKRHAPRPGMPAGMPSLAELAPHGHPLLAGWGRQARDFIRLLDHYDDVAATVARFGERRIDFFSEDGLDAAAPWLQQVQARIRELMPVGETPPAPLPPTDRSIVFHVAHHALREVEVLHDQLLHLLATGTASGPLAPRDIVVMVPDVATFEPAIRAVFGQHEGTADPRHIPYRIADLRDRGRSPALVALEWLLGARTDRFTLSGLRALLDVAAVRARFGFEEADVPVLGRWLETAGVRWGLHAEQRGALGLGMVAGQNTWFFGLRRLLLGYAVGTGCFAGIEACDEVGGLEAARLGGLACLMEAIEQWWQVAGEARSPAEWAGQLRELRAAIFLPNSPADSALALALDEALARWLEDCAAAGFTEPVDLEVVREAWLEGVDDPGIPRKFRAAGVTFCTLLPLRAVPFRVVCLLGMNDGDYPRRALRMDFDLMARTGRQRPGDRSGRDDDRQLMLDALLSARDVLYCSWAGRSQRDDSEQPPSVLVAQLRDYLAAVWSQAAVEERTTVHPLQPFSERYFAASAVVPQCFTYAREWRAAHVPETLSSPAEKVPESSGSAAATSVGTVAALPEPTEDELARFLKNPVREFFRARLGVQFAALEAAAADEEPFSLDGLEQWGVRDDVLQAVQQAAARAGAALSAAAGRAAVEQAVARLARAGRLPLGTSGTARSDELIEQLSNMVEHWRREQAEGNPSALSAGRLAKSDSLAPRPEKLLAWWVNRLFAARGQRGGELRLIAPEGAITLNAGKADAAATLAELCAAWRQGVHGEAPLPTALKTGLAFLGKKEPAEGRRAAAAAFEFGFGEVGGEGTEPCLARLYQDFDALEAAGAVATGTVLPGAESATSGVEAVSAFEYWSRRLYTPLLEWAAEQGELQPYEGCAAAADGEPSDD